MRAWEDADDCIMDGYVWVSDGKGRLVRMTKQEFWEATRDEILEDMDERARDDEDPLDRIEP